jgi:hypothetical protein
MRRTHAVDAAALAAMVTFLIFIGSQALATALAR